MKKIILTVALFCNTAVFSQLRYMNSFKKNKYDLYEMTFTNAKEAILKYNYVSDKNGADTSGYVYNIMENPIDFAFFKNEKSGDMTFVSILFYENEKYKVMFGEFDGDEERVFFDIIDGNGELITLVYRK
jgi:competence transcription factor ComK